MDKLRIGALGHRHLSAGEIQENNRRKARRYFARWARQSAWYAKSEAPFADALAAVRRARWLNSPSRDLHTATANSSHKFLDSLLDTLCYAA